MQTELTEERPQEETLTPAPEVCGTREEEGILYTLTKEENRYTLRAEGYGYTGTLRDFTENRVTAETFFTLVSACAVSPLHIRDIWSDMNE